MPNPPELYRQLTDYLHHMPKWQYRALLGIIFFLSSALALSLVVALIYGFGLIYPRIRVVNLDVGDMVVDPVTNDISLVTTSVMETFNPNIFPIHIHPTYIHVYTDPARTNYIGR